MRTSYLAYALTVCRHKWFVFCECVRRGHPLMGLMHDWSKFRPSEFVAYAHHFNGPGDPEGFDLAWLRHQRRNKHHWQWWVLREDEGGRKALAMPSRHRVEMLCDWIGAGRAYGNADTYGWYASNVETMFLHPATQKWIEIELTNMPIRGTK